MVLKCFFFRFFASFEVCEGLFSVICEELFVCEKCYFRYFVIERRRWKENVYILFISRFIFCLLFSYVEVSLAWSWSWSWSWPCSTAKMFWLFCLTRIFSSQICSFSIQEICWRRKHVVNLQHYGCLKLWVGQVKVPVRVPGSCCSLNLMLCLQNFHRVIVNGGK